MAKDNDRIDAGLGAQVTARVPETGGGAFVAARLASVVEILTRIVQTGANNEASGYG
jgi:hypothetical protein